MDSFECVAWKRNCEWRCDAMGGCYLGYAEKKSPTKFCTATSVAR